MDRDSILGLLIIFVIGALVAQILYLVTLQNTLKAVKPENREMEPGQVWLVFIPLFGIVWQFIMVTKIADSLKKEFNQRGIEAGEDRPGYNLGITYCSLYCAGILPLIGTVASLAGLIVWIIYWTKMVEFKAKLGNPNGYSEEVLDL